MKAASQDYDLPHNVPEDRVVDFDMNHDPRLKHDYFAAWERIRSGTPHSIMWSPHNGGHWILVRAAHFRQVFDDTQTFSNKSISFPPDITSATSFIPLQLDPPEHDVFRKIIMREFSPSRIKLLQPTVRALASDLIEAIRPKGSCDFVTEYAEILPVHIFLSLVGLPADDRLMLRDLVIHLNNPTPDVNGETLVQLVDAYLAPHVAQRLENPGDDLFSRILAHPIGDRRWTHEEAMRMCRNLLFGGLDTVVSMLSFVTLFLAQNPQAQETLRAEPETIPNAAYEFTRRFGTTTLGRLVTAEVEIDGVKMKKGDMVALPTALHNLDEKWLPDAPDVVFDRGPTPHMSMGAGPHRCVGEGLARLELICFLQEWLARMPEFKLGGAIAMRGGGVGAITTLPLSWRS